MAWDRRLPITTDDDFTVHFYDKIITLTNITKALRQLTLKIFLFTARAQK